MKSKYIIQGNLKALVLNLFLTSYVTQIWNLFYVKCKALICYIIKHYLYIIKQQVHKKKINYFYPCGF